MYLKEGNKVYFMESSRIGVGSVLDTLLDGGLDNDVLTTVFGPAGSGKTNLCILAAIKVALTGKKVIYVDTEGGFSAERLNQLSADHKIMENILFLKPTTFEEQRNDFEKLRNLMNDRIGLIIVDSISMLYRLELGKTENVYEVNSILGQQLSFLSEIARKRNIPVMITNQVYSDMAGNTGVKMVGGDMLKYSSKCLIELQNSNTNLRKAILRKHRALPEKEIMFRILMSELSVENK